jgi:hypothetical protein
VLVGKSEELKIYILSFSFKLLKVGIPYLCDGSRKSPVFQVALN